MYAQGLAVQPDDVSANQNFALLLMEAGQYDRARTPLRRLRSLRPEQLPVRVSLIECDLKAGYVEQAQQEISSFLALPGLTDSDRMKAAQLFVEQHVPQAAETVLRDTVRRHDNSAEAHAGLGKLLLERKQHEDAVRELGRAAQLAPDAPGYSLGLAEALLDWRHFGPAYELLKAVQPKFGTLPDFKYKMGLALFGLNLFPQAIPQFEALVRERPKADSGWFSLGNSWAAMGKLNDAETCYRRAIALNDRNGSYYAALGQVLRHSDEDRTAEAINAFTEAVRLDPSDAQSRVELAICYERGRRFTEAQELLERAILQHPDLTQAHVALARVYYKLHRTADGDRERKMAAQLQGKEQNKQAAQSDQAEPEPLR
jgi:cytochrome c-type biogenesis protein CcmH/NrfG